MTTSVIRLRRAPTAPRVSRREIAVALVLVVPWGAVTVSVWLGRVSVPGRVYPMLLYGIPVLSIGGFLAARDERMRSVLAAVAAGTSLVSAAIVASVIGATSPLAIAGLAGVGVATAAVRRLPWAAIAGLFAISGTYGSLYVFTPMHPGLVVQGAFAGLWIVALAEYLRSARRPRFIVPPGVLLVVGYVVLTIGALFVQRNGFGSVRAFLTSVWLMAGLVVLAYGPWSTQTMRRVVVAILVVGLFVGAYASLRWIIGPAAKEQFFIRQAATYGFTAQGQGGAKVIGSFPNGPALGAWSAAVLPFCLAVTLFGPRRLRPLAIGLPLMFVGLLASGNRGSLVAAAAGTVVVVALALTARANVGNRFAKVAAFSVAAVLCGAALFPTVVGDNPAKIARYANILTPSRDASFNARLGKWEAAMADAAQNPFGHGLGTASPGARAGRFPSPAANNVDSAYVQVAFEQGIPVMILFIVALLSVLGALVRRARRAADGWRAAIGIGAAGTLAAFLVVCVTGQFQFDLASLGTWVIVGVGLAPFVKLHEQQG